MTTRKIRMTQQRRFILEELRRIRSHPSADEIYEKVRRRLPRISLGTVYRNLNILTECGMIQRLETGSAQRLFDGDPRAHYHLRCVVCGRVEDAPVEPIIAIEDALRELSDYEIIGHRLEFIGVCPHCKQKG
ncbi:MAG: transcriptional repressor [Deltaproteobacteria bacterium]|nr:transcriptional repressor [Deltaproteobacteria bacterium]